MTKSEEEFLANQDVRYIQRDLLAKYNDSARTEKTRIEEVKHFLPRYLELVSEFDFPSHSAELSFSRIMMPFDETEWYTEEKNLLKDFQFEFFKECLSVYPLPKDEKIEAILIMFYSAAFDIKPLLNYWEHQQSLESVLHFRDLSFDSFNEKNRSVLSNAFGDKAIAEILKDWIGSSTVKKNFSEAIEKIIVDDREVDERDAGELELLYEVVRGWY